MGTSGSYGGPGGGTPLVPTWLDSDAPPADPPSVPPPGGGDEPLPVPPPPAPPDREIPPPGAPGRFMAARNNFSRFASSGGSDRASLGRSVASYVSKASGGPRQAARRMGSSQRANAELLRFLIDVQNRGSREALRALNLEKLAGRPIDEIFLGLSEYVCPDGGTVDEGIAREAFIETIADLAGAGVTDLDALTPDQIQTVLELYATHAIEARLCNDIGANTITFPADVRSAERVQAQLRDFIRRGVADALTSARAALQTLTSVRVAGFVTAVYEMAFGILQTLGETTAERA